MPEQRDDIVAYRHSEVIRADGFPVDVLLKGILCRTQAERETLLYLLRQSSEKLYERYREMIFYKPSLRCFFNNGIFVKLVNIFENIVTIHFNDPELRLQSREKQDVKVRLMVQIIQKDALGNIVSVREGQTEVDYYTVRSRSFSFNKEPLCHNMYIRIMLDDALMYENEVTIRNELF